MAVLDVRDDGLGIVPFVWERDIFGPVRRAGLGTMRPMPNADGRIAPIEER
jgi:hypothetical protein